ncbi:hypothetical protein HDU87_005719 [Geranomyces variabilis]|uniref:Conserved oligomeric Golgi complex subunit 7 n=1 Tax=Geranomyces variabilis TaxID=109894 RepID=A0AAD5XLL0_9FUNG|nr:hypothetical protein HDU87_005719 [Geranomyces variabilis]
MTTAEHLKPPRPPSTAQTPPPPSVSRALSGVLASSPANAYGIDIDAFLVPDFDLKKWVNDALSAPPPPPPSASVTQSSASAASRAQPQLALHDKRDDDRSASAESLPRALSRQSSLSSLSNATGSRSANIDQLASGLVLKLQLLSLDVSGKFEQLSDEVVRNMPRALYDLEVIRKDAKKVGEALVDGKRDFDRAERGGGGAFKDLVKLDLVRGRMVATRLALKEAENWSTLAGEMDAIFAAEDFEKASLRLEEAQRSLTMLSATPDYAEREALLLELQTKLQSTIEPRAMAVLTDHDAEAARKLYRVFVRIQKSGDFVKHYNATQTMGLMRFWQEYDEDSTVRAAQAGNDDELAEWLTQFYDEILRILGKELPWCGYVFPNPQRVVHDLVRTLFASLRPSFEIRVRALAERVGEAGLLTVVKAYQATVQFGLKLERLLCGSGGARSPGPTSPSRQTGIPPSPTAAPFTVEELAKWGDVPFDAFLAYQQRYGQLEQDHLVFLANNLLAAERTSDYMEITRAMADSAPKLTTCAEAALLRCRVFTAGFGTAELVSALDEFFTAAFARYDALLLRLRGEIGLATTEQERAADFGSSTLVSTDEFGGGELGRQEWGNFQVGLKVLGVCGALRKRLDTFEQAASRALAAAGTKALAAQWRTPTEFWLEDKKNVGGSDECMASFLALRTSTLNSYELRNVLDAMTGESAAASVELSTSTTTRLPADSILRRAHPALLAFTIASQRFVFDTLFSLIDAQLATLPSMPTWAADARTTAGPFDLDVPQFSLSPSSYVTRVGEHLLTLPQQLDLYVGDEALACEIERLPFLKPEAANPEEAGVSSEARPGGETSDHSGEDNNDEEQDDDDITYLWIKSISLATMALYTDRASAISRLSADGAKQLATDVRYLGNVFEAMDVDRSPLFRVLLDVLEVDAGGLAALVGTTRSKKERELVERVGRIRGIGIARYP